MEKYIAVLESLQNAFSLNTEETIRIASHISAGHRLVAAGIATWSLNGKGELRRVTTQLNILGLQLICDDSFLFQELMADLGCLEVQLMEDAALKDLDRCLYLYTLDPKNPKVKLHFFTRVLVDKEDIAK